MICCLCCFRFRIFFSTVRFFFCCFVDLDFKMLSVSCILNSWVHRNELKFNVFILKMQSYHIQSRYPNVFPALHFQFDTFFFSAWTKPYVCICSLPKALNKQTISLFSHFVPYKRKEKIRKLKLKEGGQNCRIQQLCCLQIEPGMSASFWFINVK